MSGRIRLLQITRTMVVGGMEEVVATLCRTVDRSRFEPAVLCLRGEGLLADELREEGIPILSIESDPSRPDYFAGFKVARMMREWRPDVVHTHNTTALLFGVFGAKLARVPRIIHTDHSRKYPERWHIGLAEYLLSHAVDHFVAVSDETAHDLANHLRIPTSKLITVLNGIQSVPCDDTIGAAKRQELGMPADAFVIGLAVRLVPQKGLPHLLDAVGLLRSRYPQIHLVLMGEGEQAEALRAQASRLGVEDVVHFLGVRRDVREVLQGLDAYVLSSTWEGLPMGLLEAMAAGRPIVATTVGGVQKALEHEVSGLLVEPGAPEQLATAIARLIDDPDLARRLGQSARQAFEDRFSARMMTSRYEALYLGAAETQTA